MNRMSRSAAAEQPGERASHYVVGYNGDKRSKDALRLAAALAKAFRAELDIVCILRQDDPHSQVYPPVGDVSPMIRKQAAAWLQEAMELVPQGVVARSHLRTSRSVAAGLLDAVTEFSASLVVVGAASGTYTAKFSVGPVTDTLLHRAGVPVALAPRGYKGAEGISRLYAGIGTRPGAQRIMSEAQEAVSRSGLELSLLSFLPLDQVAGAPGEAIARVEESLEEAARRISTDCPVSVKVAHGKNLKKAVSAMDWEPDSVLMVGSSRLAGDRQTFLGATTARILRHLPIPMIVLPLRASEEGTSS